MKRLGGAMLKHERGCLTDSETVTLFSDLIRADVIDSLPFDYAQTARQLVADRKISPAGRILVRR